MVRNIALQIHFRQMRTEPIICCYILQYFLSEKLFLVRKLRNHKKTILGSSGNSGSKIINMKVLLIQFRFVRPRHGIMVNI